jgi:hypothetical protein
MRLNPLTSALRTIGLALTGRLHFPAAQRGAVFTAENGQRFTVFRHAVIDPAPTQPEKPGAVFLARFRLARMSARKNIWFSLLPIPFLVGLPDFRSKRWMLDETSGDCAGYYEWDSVEAAENYSRSFAVKFMIGRSVPGSVSFTIYPADRAPAPPARIGFQVESENRLDMGRA